MFCFVKTCYMSKTVIIYKNLVALDCLLFIPAFIHFRQVIWQPLGQWVRANSAKYKGEVQPHSPIQQHMDMMDCEKK